MNENGINSKTNNEIGLLNSQLKEYTSNSNKVIQFKLITCENDIENENITFNPIFTHQIFGENETIFGYKDLKIKYYVTCGTLTTYLGIEYSNLFNNSSDTKLKIDNILDTLSKSIKHDYTTNIDVYTQKIIDDQSFRPFGDLIQKYSLKSDQNKERFFEVFKSNILSNGFKEYYQRLQTFILFFIDAASFIDIDDEKWNYYLVYEVLDNQKYSIVGYLTVYNYYAYLNMIRPRISQVLILPPYQRNGHATYLLQSVYDDLIPNSSVLDITVECPSNNFVKVRDYVDVRNFLKLKEFQNKNFKNISNVFYNSIKQLIKEKLKLSKFQSRRVYEIVCLKHLDTNNEQEYKKYKQEIRKRLKINYLPRKKTAKCCLSEDTYDLLSNEKKKNKYLRVETNKLISLYRDVLDRFYYD